MAPGAPNPYEAPRAEVEAPTDATAPLASRWRRLGGAVVDGLVHFLANSIVYVGIPKSEVMATRGDVIDLYLRHGLWGHLAGLAVTSLMLAQSFLIARRGQSIGKMVTGTRIVTLEGSPADFVRAVVVRYWFFWIPSMILPALGVPMDAALGKVVSVAYLVDCLLIFGRNRRCFHDLLAGTKVVAVASKINAGAAG